MRLLVALFLLALACQGAGFDGHWAAETATRRKKPDAKKLSFTMDLTTKEGTPAGTVTLGGGRKSVPGQILEAQLDGEILHFTTAARQADVKLYWTMALDGTRLSGTVTREGRKKGQTFVASQAN